MRAQFDPLTFLQSSLQVLRMVDPEMPAQSVLALLYVALHPGCSQSQLREHLGISSGAVARIAARLGEWERLGKPGDRLLFNEINPADRRERQLYLTPRGQGVMEQIKRVAQGGAKS